MRLAFCLFKYFPQGGLGRDFLRIACACVERGHEVHVFTMRWESERPPGVDVTIVPVRGLTIRARVISFVREVEGRLRSGVFDAIVGFNRMPGLDVYYAADVCHEAEVRRRRLSCLRFTPRHRLYSRYERAVFDPKSSTEILVLAEQEMENYVRCYGTPASRFHLVPPGVSMDRRRPQDAGERREAKRRELGIEPDERVFLLVGSNFRIKGVARAIRALAALAESFRARAVLVIVGRDPPGPWKRLARRLGVESRVRFLGLRDDVPDLMLAADILLHPALRENTGTVLLEALAAGLPVLATATCGYAPHVARANAGRIIASDPYSQDELDRALRSAIESEDLSAWQANALAYVDAVDIHGLVDEAATRIAAIAAERVRRRP